MCCSKANESVAPLRGRSVRPTDPFRSWRWTACLALALAACDNPQLDRVTADAVLERFREASSKGPGTTVSLAGAAGLDWDRLYVFEPYTSPAAMARCLGVEPSSQLMQGIEARDDISLLVFTFTDGPPKSVVVPRDIGSFGPEAVGRGFSRERAAFIVRTPAPWTYGDLAPARGAPPRCY